MYKYLSSGSRLVNGLIERFLWMLGLSMAVLVAVQVFCRYALNGSLFWSEELARYMLIWLTFLGATVAYHRSAHPGVDVFVRRLPKPGQKLCLTVVHLLTAGIALVMVVAGSQFAWFVRLQISPALGIPKWVIVAVIPASGFVLLLHSLRKIFAGLQESEWWHEL